jgi:hypothetical protein
MYVALDGSRVTDGSGSGEALKAQRDYFSIWLSEMSLRRDRAWFKTWHPAVHSLVRLQHGAQRIEIPNVAGELNLEGVSESNLDRVVGLNYPLTTLLPFNGGTIELTAGLLAMEGSNLLASVIDTMSNLAGLLVVPQVSAALQIAAPVAEGLQSLLGGSNGELHLGLHQTFTGAGGGGPNELRPGYLAVIRATERDLRPEDLWVTGGRLQRGRSPSDLSPFSGYPFMLFRIEARSERDDWEALTTIKDPFDNAIAALGYGATETAETFRRVAVANALRCDDLTKADRSRVALSLNSDFEQARGEGLGATVVEGEHTIDKVMERSISPDQALALGEPTLEELFGGG